jgi:hypothetical protein
MLQSETNQYLSEIKLARRSPPAPRGRSALFQLPPSFSSASDLIVPGQENGAVIGEAVVGLTDRLSEDNAIDVMNCVSLAQQIAESMHNKERDLPAWTDEYNKALRLFGWTNANYVRQRYSPSATSFSMDQIALEIIRAAAGGATELTNIAEKALIGTEQNAKALNLLENNSASESLATFQTLPCTESSRGVPSMIMMSIDFKKTVKTRRVLFFKFNKTQVTINRAAGRYELNVRAYANIRNRVEDLLYQGANDYLEGITL